MAAATMQDASLKVTSQEGGRLEVVLGGDWRARHGLPGLAEVEAAVAGGGLREMTFEMSGLRAWNTGLLAWLLRCLEIGRAHQLECRLETLPEGLHKLVDLAQAVPEKADARRQARQGSFLQRVGESTIRRWGGASEIVEFIGQNVQALGRLMRGKAQFRWSDAFVVMQEAGPEALGIVILINFLVGLILAFVGAVQLVQFGASIYVADLVAIATVREMGCIMTGIIVCGRTGAAFAAQLGTMKVNQEIEAFRTFGISAIDFLVLPRMLALVLMMPLLCVFADVIGILGGFFVAISMLDLTVVEYLNRTIDAISLTNFALGIIKGSFFGLLVALTGCLRGMQCGSNAAAVGQATTSAVVAGITSIIAADGIFAVLCNALKI